MISVHCELSTPFGNSNKYSLVYFKLNKYYYLITYMNIEVPGVYINWLYSLIQYNPASRMNQTKLINFYNQNILKLL